MIAEPINAVVKTCGCGRAYDADTWAALPLCGYVGAYEGASGERRTVELRHCECRSTIALEVPAPQEARAA